MTTQSSSNPPLETGEDETKWSLLRRLILAIAADRQKKADKVVREYLQRQAESPDQS
jgi:hypothetical protein